MYLVTHALERGSNVAFLFPILQTVLQTRMWSGFSILFYFFIPDSSNLTTTSEEILQWYSSTYSDYSEEDYMCVPWLLGPDCCRSVAGRKTQWLCYQEHYEKAQDLMCSCADERIISEQEKKKNQSHTGWLIELKTEHGKNMMAHAFLFKRNVQKNIVYLNALVLYMYYFTICKDATCYFKNYTF